MERKEVFKKTMFWNRVCMVLGVLGVLITLFSTVPMFLGAERLIELYEQQNLPTEGLEMFLTVPYKIYTIVFIVLSIVITVLYFVNQSKLKKEIIPSKFVYYLKIIVEVLSVVITLFISTVNVWTFIMTAVACLFPAMVIVNLFKLDEEGV